MYMINTYSVKDIRAKHRATNSILLAYLNSKGSNRKHLAYMLEGELERSKKDTTQALGGGKYNRATVESMILLEEWRSFIKELLDYAKRN